ncbi:hypothetical protein AYO38_10815 [bacterium SCGC AG-212-C10]|nr:hypothetical protein AYO38_10815 [bacterium SCGC AG-212-C10]
MTDPPMASTPHQTIGPFYAVMLPLGSNEIVPERSDGAIRFEGVVYDGGGSPVTDAVIEIWQANAAGRYAHAEDTRDLPLDAGFSGWGRTSTDADGRFAFRTVKPGRVPFIDERLQAPHISVTIFARGLLRHLHTRLYFPDEAAANAVDPVLLSIADEAHRQTLVARPLDDGTLRFDIHLRGEHETVFFDV